MELPSDKRVYVEFLRGDSDGLMLDSASNNIRERQLLEMAFALTGGGSVGRSWKSWPFNVIREMIENPGEFQREFASGPPAKYVVVERLEEGVEILIRVERSQ